MPEERFDGSGWERAGSYQIWEWVYESERLPSLHHLCHKTVLKIKIGLVAGKYSRWTCINDAEADEEAVSVSLISEKTVTQTNPLKNSILQRVRLCDKPALLANSNLQSAHKLFRILVVC